MNDALRQLFHELEKLFARKRTYIGFVAIVAAECAILRVLSRPQSISQFRHLLQEHGLPFDQYYSGLTIAFEIVAWTNLFLGGLFLALVAGDLMAKEVEEGTLRMLLCRPVSRLRIVMLKYISCVIYTFALILFLGATALAVGLIYRGKGNLFVLDSVDQFFSTNDAQVGLERYGFAIPLLAFGLTSVSSIGFMFSCLRMKPAAATIATLAILFVDSTLRRVPFFENLRPLFLSTHLAAWEQVFAAKIPWARVCQDYCYLLAVDAICLMTALLFFQRRDFKA